MGGSSQKHKVAKHQSSSKSNSDKSSSSGHASGSAPHSTHSHQSTSRYDGASSPPQAKSPSSPVRKSPPQVKSPEDKQSRSTQQLVVKPKNYDLGASQWSLIDGFDDVLNLPTRPKVASKLGVDAKVGLNTFNVITFPTREIFQYEVMIGNGVEKRGVIKAVWNSKQLKRILGTQVLFDGDHLAWGFQDIKQEIRELIDLDKEKGRTPKPGKEDRHRVLIRQRTTIDFSVLQKYLAGKQQWNKACLEAINCLDHILREHPSGRLVAVKRAFYPEHGERMDLGGGLEVVKGAYQSLRLAHTPVGPTLTVNVDVSNCTFWKPIPLVLIMLQLTGCRDVNDLIRGCKQQSSSNRIRKELKRLQKRRVVTGHRKDKKDEYVIDRFEYAGAKATTFTMHTSQGDRTISVYDYFKKEYNVTINHPDLPLVRSPKGAYIPVELLNMAANQPCKYRLNENQTAQMIKFAVTPPQQRWQAVQEGLKTLNWAADPVLNAFGLKISANRTVVPARVLTAPKVIFGAGGSAAPGTSGRWDLKGKKFLTVNTAPLKVWGVMIIQGSRGGKPDRTVVDNFIKAFVNGYVGHGGRVETKQPPYMLNSGNDIAEWTTQAWNTIGQKFNSRPQMIMFILPDKSSEVYNRIKRSMDCRYGCVSQCVQYTHVMKAQPQYISNVCMKFNAKLGGTTCRAVGARSGGATGLFTVPTVIIGADVSHAAPGSSAASAAAITCSMDALGVQYAAAVESNGYRVEMITEANINKHLRPLLQHWSTHVNQGRIPKRVIYIRDGVSEGQFAHVLQQEVHFMKTIFKEVAPGQKVDFLVLIAQKRHQIRFFPEKGDRNGNALPGTLVETGATHPFENDFYLCAHAAIKGTARPVHYQVILNEANMPNDEIYTILYEHSYQYLRATTPVSIHPAVYYAHLASNRAVCHDPRYGSIDADSSDPKQSDKSTPPIAEPYLPMPNSGGIQTVPWFI